MPKKLMARPLTENAPEALGGPVDWGDVKGWDRYHSKANCNAQFEVPARMGAAGWESVRFLNLVRALGRRVWFAGCGTSVGPRFYAEVGYNVLATDLSPVAVRIQRRFAALAPERLFTGWSAFVRQSEPPLDVPQQLQAAEHDFTTCAPNGVFDSVINCCAFQGLSPSAMSRAAQSFFTALRPGGAAILEMAHVPADLRTVIEDTLLTAGFFIPFSQSNRWYQRQLESTGIPFSLMTGRPRVRFNRNNPVKSSMAAWEQDQMILDSFTEEYNARVEAERDSVDDISSRPQTIAAHVVYRVG